MMKKIILNFEEKGKNFKELVQTAFNMNFVEFLISADTNSDFKNIERITTFSFNTEIEADNIIFIKNKDLPQESINKPNIGIYRELTSKQDELEIINLAKEGKFNFIIVKTRDWKVIPFENLIAEVHKTDTNLFASVDSITEAELMLKTLQIGTDGIVYRPKNSNEIKLLKDLILTNFIIEINKGKITNIQEVPEAERVCVDTTSLLKGGEGMLIGSTAKGFVLVHAEVFDTQFVASRPFRVNAGDVSAYILVPDENENQKYKTKYLSELKGGEKVLIVNYHGDVRIVSVGRVKIETRPMLRFELLFEKDNTQIKINYVGQNAETIRLITPTGRPISVVDLTIGDEVLIHLGPGATHFGTAINEDIIEK